jgi:hypothetical protein
MILLKNKKKEVIPLKSNKQKKEKKEINPLVKKSIIFVVIILIVMTLIGLSVFFLSKGDDKPTQEVVKKTLSTLDQYGYTLDDLDTELYKTEFNTLKANLESETINYEEYASSIAKLFAIDLYTISNKLNKYDVGGVEFIYPANRENFQLKVEDTIYRYVEDNSKGTRKQELPTVSKVSATTKTTKYTYKPDTDTSIKKDYEGYTVKVSIEYEKKSEYPSSLELTIINEDNKLYIAEIK